MGSKCAVCGLICLQSLQSVSKQLDGVTWHENKSPCVEHFSQIHYAVVKSERCTKSQRERGEARRLLHQQHHDWVAVGDGSSIEHGEGEALRPPPRREAQDQHG